MPVMKLTRNPPPIIPGPARAVLWELEAVAHGLHPEPKADDVRRKWVERGLRGHARSWTTSVCILPGRAEEQKQWYALDKLARAPDEIRDLKPNENRDAKLTALVLVDCTLGGMSKAQSISRLATGLRGPGRANSLESAEMTVKRAWKKYCAGCHLSTAWALLPALRRAADADDENAKALAFLSLAEHLRRLGETTIPKHGTRPVLDPKRTWKFPDWLSFPAVESFELDGMSGLLRLTSPPFVADGAG